MHAQHNDNTVVQHHLPVTHDQAQAILRLLRVGVNNAPLAPNEVPLLRMFVAELASVLGQN